MLAAQPIEHLTCRLGAAGLHVRKSVQNPFDGFDAVEQRLAGRGILDHELSFPATLLGFATPFVAPALLWFVLQHRFIPHEERIMSERFGDRYGRYVLQGPRRRI